jgi:hypothetical protein
MASWPHYHLAGRQSIIFHNQQIEATQPIGKIVVDTMAIMSPEIFDGSWLW